MRADWVDRHFGRLLAGLCAFFAAVECYYAAHTNLHFDEFQYAWLSDQFLEGVPFRDFAPGKTVFGYYVLALAKRLSDDPWGQLIAIRLVLVGVNVAMVAIVATGLRRIFSGASVLAAVLLLVFMSTFLERCHDIRLDVMSTWMTAGGLALLLHRRPILAGVVATLGVLISQKAVYGGFAGGAALVLAFVMLRDQRRAIFRMIVAYGLTCLALGGLYLGIAISLGGASKAIDATVTGHTTIAFANLYPEIFRYWHQTAARNPLFWMLVVIALLRLGFDQCASTGRRDNRYVFAFGFLLFYLPLTLWHRQPWPYYLAMVAPLMVMPLAALFELERPNFRAWLPLHRSIAIAIFVMLGLVVPGTRLATNMHDANSYQAETVRIAAHLLQPGETYVSGMNIIAGHEHAAADLSWLDNHHLRRIENLDDERKQAIADELRDSPMRLYLRTAKIGRHLPPPVWDYMQNHYEHRTHIIYLWSPSVSPGRSTVDTKFAGDYEVVAGNGANITIDGQRASPGDRVRLTGDTHTIETDTPLRLRLIADLPADLLPHGEQKDIDFFHQYAR